MRYSPHIWSRSLAIASNEGKRFPPGAALHKILCRTLAVLFCSSLAGFRAHCRLYNTKTSLTAKRRYRFSKAIVFRPCAGAVRPIASQAYDRTKSWPAPPRVKRGTGRWRRYAISLRGCASTCKLAGGIPHAHGHGKHWRVDSKANKAKLLHLLPERNFLQTMPQAGQALRWPVGLYDPSGQIHPKSYTCALLQKWRVQLCIARCRRKHPG